MKRIKNKLLLIIVVLSGYLIQAQPIQMTIPDDATHTVGDVIIIPVNVDNSLTGFDVLSYQFRIYFNSARLSFNSIDVAGTISDPWGTPIYNNAEPNYINIAIAGFHSYKWIFRKTLAFNYLGISSILIHNFSIT